MKGDAHRPGHDPPVVVRPRRPAARARPAARSPWRSRTRCSTWRRPARPSSRWTRPRCARACRSAPPTRTRTCAGRSTLPPRHGAGARGDAGAHAHVLLGVRRDHGPHRPPRRGRALDRGVALRHGGARRLRRRSAYPGDVGPGVYDIHSPRVPSAEEIEGLLELAEERVGREAALGEPRLRPQDPRPGPRRGRAGQHGRGGRAPAERGPASAHSRYPGRRRPGLPLGSREPPEGGVDASEVRCDPGAVPQR